MSDLISRQAAIGILYNFAGCIVDTPNGDYHRAYKASRHELELLPSAQPEIIRCKDCKYGDTFHKFDEPDMPMKCLGQHYGGTYPDDFCSYAERREE